MRRSSVRLAGTIPRRCMSSVNEVIVSSWAIFGSLTNVPLPCRRTSRPSRTSSSSAARTVRRETPRSPRAGARTGSRRPRRAARSGRARWLRVSLCFVTVRLSCPRIPLIKTTARGSHGNLLGARELRGVRHERRAVGGVEEMERAPDRRRAASVLALPRVRARVDARGEERRLGREQRRVVSLGARSSCGRRARYGNTTCVSAPSCSSTSTCTSSRGRPGAAKAASSNASGRMPSTTRAVGRPCAGVERDRVAAETDEVPVDRRLDEVHRRRADERGDEEVARLA